jgi:hypothetical protein
VRRSHRSVVVAIAVTAALGMSTIPAEAAIQTSLSGTVNCTGTWTTYSHTRYLTGYSETGIYVTKAAHSSRGGTAMGFGIRITRTGTDLDTVVRGADSWATMDTRDYLPNTAFTVRARMTPSSGTCYNSWAGTQKY